MNPFELMKYVPLIFEYGERIKKIVETATSNADMASKIKQLGGPIANLLGDLAKVTKPLIVHIADKDEFFPPEGRAKVVESVKGHKQIAACVYPDADHAFARVGGVHWDGRAAAIANGRSVEALVATLS